MARYIALVLALFLVAPYGQGVPVDEAEGGAAGVADVLSAADEKTVEERSPNYKPPVRYPKPNKKPAYEPSYEPEPYEEEKYPAEKYPAEKYPAEKYPAEKYPEPYEESYPEEKINPWVVIHVCWKPYPAVLDIYKAIVNALVTSGVCLESQKEGEVKLAAVTVKRPGKSYGNGYGKPKDVIEYVDIEKVAETTIHQASSLTHLAWSWAYAIWNNVKPKVTDVLCITVVIELTIHPKPEKYEEPKEYAEESYSTPEYQDTSYPSDPYYE